MSNIEENAAGAAARRRDLAVPVLVGALAVVQGAWMVTLGAGLWWAVSALVHAVS